MLFSLVAIFGELGGLNVARVCNVTVATESPMPYCFDYVEWFLKLS